MKFRYSFIISFITILIIVYYVTYHIIIHIIDHIHGLEAICWLSVVCFLMGLLYGSYLAYVLRGYSKIRIVLASLIVGIAYALASPFIFFAVAQVLALTLFSVVEYLSYFELWFGLTGLLNWRNPYLVFSPIVLTEVLVLREIVKELCKRR